jgi:hypothetical protein
MICFLKSLTHLRVPVEQALQVVHLHDALGVLDQLEDVAQEVVQCGLF